MPILEIQPGRVVDKGQLVKRDIHEAAGVLSHMLCQSRHTMRDLLLQVRAKEETLYLRHHRKDFLVRLVEPLYEFGFIAKAHEYHPIAQNLVESPPWHFNQVMDDLLKLNPEQLLKWVERNTE